MGERNLHATLYGSVLVVRYQDQNEVLFRVAATSPVGQRRLEQALAPELGALRPNTVDAMAHTNDLDREVLVRVADSLATAEVHYRGCESSAEEPTQLQATQDDLPLAILDLIQSVEHGFIGVDIADLRSLLGDASGPITYFRCSGEELDEQLAARLAGEAFSHVLAVFRGTLASPGITSARRNLERLQKAVSGSDYVVVAAPDEEVAGTPGAVPRVSVYGWKEEPE